MTRRLNLLYKCMKFRWNIFYSFQVIEWTLFCDRQTDARGKTILLHLTYITMKCLIKWQTLHTVTMYLIMSLWYLGVSQVHRFDWGTMTSGRLPVGFYTLILFIVKWHNIRLTFRPSVSSCHVVYLVLLVIIYRMSSSIYALIFVEIKSKTGLKLRVCNRKIFFLFFNQNICCGY